MHRRQFVHLLLAAAVNPLPLPELILPAPTIESALSRVASAVASLEKEYSCISILSDPPEISLSAGLYRWLVAQEWCPQDVLANSRPEELFDVYFQRRVLPLMQARDEALSMLATHEGALAAKLGQTSASRLAFKNELSGQFGSNLGGLIWNHCYVVALRGAAIPKSTADIDHIRGDLISRLIRESTAPNIQQYVRSLLHSESSVRSDSNSTSNPAFPSPSRVSIDVERNDIFRSMRFGAPSHASFLERARFDITGHNEGEEIVTR